MNVSAGPELFWAATASTSTKYQAGGNSGSWQASSVLLASVGAPHYASTRRKARSAARITGGRVRRSGLSEPRRLSMSVARSRWGLSIPVIQIWVIAVVAVVTLVYPPLREAVGAVTEGAALLGVWISCGTATKYSNYSNRPCPGPARPSLMLT